MDTDIWYEEELLPPEAIAAETSKQLQGLDIETLAQETGLSKAALQQDKGRIVEEHIQDNVKGVLRIQRPRARRVTAAETGTLPGSPSDGMQPHSLAQGELFLVRLGMELDVAASGGKTAGWAYRQAWCRAYLFAQSGSVQPRLLDIFPQRLYEGQPTTVQLKAEPAIKIAAVGELGLGSIATDLKLGQVTPVTLGFFGDEERNPYWQLQEKEKPLRGVFHFWLLLEQPPGCGPIRLAMLGEGDLQTSLFTIPVGPKVREMQKRPSMLLVDMLA